MSKITFPDKVTGNLVTASEINQIKTIVNNNDDAKAPLVSGKVPAANLPDAWFEGITGTGTEEDPYTVAAGGLSTEELITFFRSLPGWAPDRILQGDLTWIDPPTGQVLEQLDTPILTIVEPTFSDAISLGWTTVPNGVTYTLQRDTSNAFSTPVTVYTGLGDDFLDSGLTPSTHYYYRLKATASGYAGSSYATDDATTDVPGNITPAAPTSPVTNDTTNTFNWTNNPTYTNVSDYEQTLDGGDTITNLSAKPIVVGNIYLPAGEVGVRVKAATGRNISPWLYNSVAFTITPDAPTIPITDNTGDTFGWTNSSGYVSVSDYEFTTDSGATYNNVSVNPQPVGNFAYANGVVGVRVKAATGRSASTTLYNTVPFTVAAEVTNPVIIWPTLTRTTVSGNTVTSANGSGTNGYALSSYRIASGGVGYVMFDIPDLTSTIYTGLGQGETTVNTNSAMEYAMLFSAATSKITYNVLSTSYPQSAVITPSSNTKARIRLDGTTAYFEYTTDGGTTWSLINSVPQVAAILFIKVYAPASTTGRLAPNVRHVGFTTS